jgi:hypothetical protein
MIMSLNEDEVITVEQAYSKYPREWLGVKVVARDKNSGQPVKIKILSKHLNLASYRNKLGANDICILYTGPIPEINHVALF